MCPLPHAHGLSLRRLYVEDMFVAIPIEHSLAGNETLSIRDLKDEALLLISR